MSAVTSFEAMMTSNFTLESLDEVLKYIANVVNEPREEGVSIDSTIDAEKVFGFLRSKFTFDPSESQLEVITSVINNLDDHDLERMYFKNNLLEFLRTDGITEIFSRCFDEDYQDPMKPPASVKDAVEELHAFADYFLFYPYQWERKDKRLQNMKRKCVLISDTDSSFLNLNPAVEWFEESFNGGERMERKSRVAICNIVTYLITKFVDKVFDILTTNM